MTAASVAAQVTALQSMTVAELRVKWREVFGQETKQRHRIYLWKRLARQLQKDQLPRLTPEEEATILGRILDNLSGERIAFANLASEVRVSPKTVRNWVDTFCMFHHGFLVRPWFRNVQKGLRKEPKWFLRDCTANYEHEQLSFWLYSRSHRQWHHG